MLRRQTSLSRFQLVALATMPLAWLAVSAVASNANASILQSGLLPDSQDVLASLDQDCGAGGMTTDDGQESPQESTPSQPNDDSNDAPSDAFLPAAPSQGGTTSSSSPSSGASSGGAMSFMAQSAICLEDEESSTRLAICQAILLPEPLGADLLRPPQR